MTTTRSHANCTHEKTKAARAACRAGKLGDASQPTDATKATARAKLREKATPAAAKLSPTKAEGWGRHTRGGAVSGTCARDDHDRCMAGGAQWFCTCPCHTEVRVHATDRDEAEPCQASTPGCSIDHDKDRGPCETW